MDRLAKSGLLYTRAYSQSPWTLPSHVTMFTGLLPSQHRTGWRATHAPDELVMLAELLVESGYQTFGISENTWITETFNVGQGFEEFHFSDPDRSQVVVEIARWSQRLDPQRPFLAFVNVVDPHAPYQLHPHCQNLPRGLTRQRALDLPQEPGLYFCVADHMPLRVAWLHALYHCDVSAADRKLERIHGALSAASEAAGRRLISIVTSDHGEHFGEHALVSHQFSVRDELLHVPLIVQGLEAVASGVIEAPVQLADLAPSILRWASLEPPEAMIGRTLPTHSEAGAPRTILAEYADFETLSSDTRLGRGLIALARGMRRQCTESDRVFGDMRSVIRYPWKLTLYERYSAELFDLAQDPEEATNLAESREAELADLRALISALPGDRDGAGDADEQASRDPEISDEVLRLLESLGYVESEPPSGPVPAPPNPPEEEAPSPSPAPAAP